LSAVLYLIPTALGGDPKAGLSPEVIERVRGLRDFAAEVPKSARAFLAALGMPCPMREVRIEQIAGKTENLLAPLREGRPLGVLSEAGCPGVADPGQALVAAAHAAGYRVAPLVGPSAILLALMASGLDGQRFAFCGYLPREPVARLQRIRELERRSRSARETQIFIETPYRNDVLLAALLEACGPDTRLCVASDLTLPTEEIVSRRVADWRAARRVPGRRPSVFLMLA
jgi:16S rRNA (cytidine1402-2'-O)-methyltransferase